MRRIGVGLTGGWDPHEESGSAALGVGRMHAPAVRVHDGGDDRESQAGAGPPPLAPALGAPEPLEERAVLPAFANSPVGAPG